MILPEVVFILSTKRAAGSCVASHAHSCYELVYYHAGKGVSVMGNKKEDFRSHTFAVIPPSVEHEEWHERDCEVCFVGFVDECPLPCGIYDDDEAHSVGKLMTRIATEKRDRQEHSEQMLALLTAQLLITLKRIKGKKREKPADPDYAKRFLDENYGTKVSFADLARSLGYGYDYFRHKFCAAYGLSPQQYLINVRLEKAKQLVESSDLNCTEIAYACGFSDSAQFSTMYKKCYGISPKRAMAERKN